MKIIVIFVILIQSISFLFAEDCGSALDCDKSLKYPYLTCTPKLTLCSDDPINLSPPVRKGNMPICLEYDPKGAPSQISLPNETGMEVVFDPSRMEEEMECARNPWNCVCGKENTPCSEGCIIKVVWSNKSSDFETPTQVANANSHWFIDDCTYNCAKSKIFLNSSDSWRDKKIDGHWRLNFCNSDVDYYKREPGIGYNTFNICDILMHEVGHILVLDHTDIYHCNNPDEKLEPTKFSRMRSTMGSNRDLQGLTDYDKCAVALLHCPSVTHVKNELVDDKEYYLSPNPATDFITINEENIHKYQTYEISDIMGRVVQSGTVESDKIILNDFPKGIYFLKLIGTTETKSMKFLRE